MNLYSLFVYIGHNGDESPKDFYSGFIPNRKEPVCVCCESLKERVVWLVIQLLYDTVSVFVFVYSGIKYGRSIINGELTPRLLMSYIYGAPILDVSRSHTTTQHSR